MQTTPVMCKSEFTGDGLLRHLSAMEIYPPFGPSPVLHPFWAAGISFSRGHFVARVPYDCCLPMMFQGEEISMAARAWSHGYDFYSPVESVVFHPYDDRARPLADERAERALPSFSKRYNRKSKPKMFWENANQARRRRGGARSARDRRD